MTDTTVHELLAWASTGTIPALLVMDENCEGSLPAPVAGLQVISNRYDIYRQAQAAGWTSTFNDFDFSAIPHGSIASAYYRISKEKKVVEHVLQNLWSRLQLGGCLYIAGYKNEGIKTFAKRMTESWLCNASLTRGKHQLHLYRLEKAGSSVIGLTDDSYSSLVHIGDWNSMALWSKPGIFAWDRLDDGSAFLLEQLPTALAGKSIPRRGLDLGCGSGLLSLALLKAGCTELLATDNNAAALQATACNLQLNATSQQWSVQPADAGEGIRFSADLLLCNPPFHQGFAVENALTGKFLQAAHRMLAPRGEALFVVNSFIALEKLAAGIFADVETLADNRRFKVVRLQHQRSRAH